jgi:DNA mismatch repair protein MutL
VAMPLNAVDVNVHPSKREVRYTDGQALFSLVRASVQQALEQKGFWQQAGIQPMGGAMAPNPQGGFGVSATGSRAGFGLARGTSGASWPTGLHSTRDQSRWQTVQPLFQPLNPQGHGITSHPEQSALTDGATVGDQQAILPPGQFRVIGQLFMTYMLVETRQGLMVIDQHIASERVLFEQFSQQLMAHNPDFIQPLLVPITRQLRPSQTEPLQQCLPQLDAIGVTGVITNLDDNTDPVLAISHLPSVVPTAMQQAVVDALIDNVLGTHAHTTGTHAPVVLPLHDMAATMACHAAVRAGDALTVPDMEKLMAQWLQCQLPWSCPHGRPIAHTIPSHDVNRFFERPSLPVNAFSGVMAN